MPEMEYVFHENGQDLGIKCLVCGHTSWNERDRQNLYCEHCKTFGTVKPDPVKDLVCVFTNKQLAALVYTATAGLVFTALRNGGKPSKQDLDIAASVAEAVDIANSAMGNPLSEEFHATVERLRRMAE